MLAEPLWKGFCTITETAGDTLTLKSYAKVNLALDVLGRRADGFHEVDTVLYEIDLADELEFRVTREAGCHLTVEEGEAPPGDDNLVLRAAKAAAGLRAYGGLEIRLKKRIPMQAGLGGGSSNAAAAIIAVSELLGTDGAPRAVAASIGSDVPFFLCGGTARATGRGDQIQFVPSLVDLDMLIVKPEAGVSTPWAYAQLDRVGHRGSARSAESVLEAVRKDDRRNTIARMRNDFEQVVLDLLPEARALKERLLEAGAEAALLCGSGSAVFGVFPSKEAARRAGEEFGDVWHAEASGTVRPWREEEP